MWSVLGKLSVKKIPDPGKTREVGELPLVQHLESHRPIGKIPLRYYALQQGTHLSMAGITANDLVKLLYFLLRPLQDLDELPINVNQHSRDAVFLVFLPGLHQ